MRMRRITALARYALAGNLRTPYTWAGGALFLALTFLGLWGSARAGDGWVIDASLTADGALLAAVFGVRSGLIAQRIGGTQTYLRMNFMSPAEHVTGAAVSLVVSWLLVCAGFFLVNLLLPGGGLRLAAWETAFFAARTGVLIPLVLVTESVTTIDIPFFLPALIWLGLLMTLVFTLGEVEAMAALAPPVRRFDYGTLLPSVWRVATAWGLVFPALIFATAWRGGRRRGRGRGAGPGG